MNRFRLRDLFHGNNFRFFREILSLIFLLLLASVSAQEVTAEHGMVASAQPLASRAGLEILQKGGNAVDAAVATAFALGVVEPNASGLGGGGFMVIRMADGSPALTIDYREMAPGKAEPGLYYTSKHSLDSLTRSGAKSVGVPGTVAGLALALEKYGTMSLAEVLQPAIRLALDGYRVTENFSAMILNSYELIQQHPATAAIYLQNDFPPPAGTVIKNPDLAHSYELLAQKGASEFYRGEIGEAIVKQLGKEGGFITRGDLQKYRAILKKPVTGSYRGYRIISSAPPTGGGTHLVELLNILEKYDLKKLGHNSADYLHILAEAMKMVFADKNLNMADPAFYRVPVKKLTDKSYADKLRERIRPDRARFDYRAPQLVSRESGSTTHLSVVDKDRNMVALTQSINLWFGSGITVEGTGILLNNHLRDFSRAPGKPNSIEPYKRPVSSIAPTILLKDGKPVLTIGTPGGTRIISALAQIIINIVDFGMDIDAAIEAPRIHAYGKTLNLEGRIPTSVVKELEKRGHKVRMREDYDKYFGGAQGILIEGNPLLLHGGADSRRDGMAVGY